MEEKIRHLLASLVHPETGQDIVSSGFIEHIASAAGKITVVLRFAKARDPFAVKIKNQAEELLKREFPDQTVLVVIKEGGAAPRPEPKLKTTTGGIANPTRSGGGPAHGPTAAPPQIRRPELLFSAGNATFAT